MALKLKTMSIPIQIDADGIARVGGTRVTLETVIMTFNEGGTAEEIAFRYPALSPSDIYAVIGYYLQNHASIDGYLAEAEAERAVIQQGNEVQFTPITRAELLARFQDEEEPA